MAAGDVTLTLNTISVTISGGWGNFLDKTSPRLDSHSQEVDFSQDGTVNVNGPAFPDRCIWSFRVVLTAEQEELIRLMWREQNRLRATQQAFQITLDDETSRFLEDSPRTRAIVPTTTENSPAAPTGYTAYYGRFNAIFTSEVTPVQVGKRWGVSWSMIEGDLSA